MRTLIIYDSLFGNTEKIANAIKKGLGEEGVSLVRVSEFKEEKIKDIDFIIVGSPTHGGRPSQKTKNFLGNISNENLKSIYAAAFDTGMTNEGQGKFIKLVIKFFNYAAPRIAKILEKKGSKIVGAETFFVLGKEGPLKKGELERAQKWAKDVINKIK